MESLKVKPLVREVFVDNGEHSHYELLDAETGKVLWTEEEKDEKFEKAAEPMIKYLAENHHPHMQVLIDSTSAILLEQEKMYTNSSYVVD
jgi:hypothetical protein